ncbi:Alpha-ketoglutarate-dependent taurine dioxygenase [Cupriavidus basilensis]|uniref:Alpha-ketoglutarate-dependent taurine dioxygenase n=1 Tax=Cupriavidus basilensis TaxID=68895 RepID=A0A0C4YG99_9BURK|nr:Alpha-ketoglutarate-dependent taurine dioxygenase [Cupriavidus basilensis]
MDPIAPCLGAEIGNIDLRMPLDDDQYLALRAALLKHKVLFFRDQDISAAQQVALASRFGELEVHPVFPHHPDHRELVVLGGDSAQAARENIFHTDVSWRKLPSMGSILRCLECPAVGGDTLWVNMVAVHAGLPAAVRDRIAGLHAVHDILPAFGSRMNAEQREARRQEFPAATHPVVRIHPETGEKILYVNEAFTTHLADYLEKHEGQYRFGFDFRLEEMDLLQYLFRQANAPEYQVRLRWRHNTIAFWDNRSTQHYAIQDYFPARRRMLRATIIGDAPF